MTPNYFIFAECIYYKFINIKYPTQLDHAAGHEQIEPSLTEFYFIASFIRSLCYYSVTLTWCNRELLVEPATTGHCIKFMGTFNFCILVFDVLHRKIHFVRR